MLRISVLFLVYLFVIVRGSQDFSVEDQVWILGTSVNITVGPENAVYCRVTDYYGYEVFDGFGPCRIVVDRVTTDHRGAWKLFVAVSGTFFLQKHEFSVDIQSAVDLKPAVTTSVVTNAPSVLLTCSVPAQYEVQACKFRDPRGNILVTSHGVGQDEYSFRESAVSYELEAGSHSCTLRLTNPVVENQGMWRCAVDTTQETYYGFLTVVCPWLSQDDLFSPSITEPVLQPVRYTIRRLEGDAVVMSCFVDAAIRYCYFRTPNGTIFNVGPSITSPHYEYVGSGFDAGECGIRYSSLLATDTGTWTCHVGLADTTPAERQTWIGVQILEKLSVSHSWVGPSYSTIEVYASVNNDHPIEYCRFIRFDGQGFTSDIWYPGYRITLFLNSKHCYLHVYAPVVQDELPWTVAVKIVGIDGEITKSTIDTPLIRPPAPQEPELEAGGIPLGCVIFLWLSVIIFCFLLISAGVALIPKKNREWMYDRASLIRNSFRKQPLHNDILTDLSQKNPVTILPISAAKQ